jgi:hypothetical protein
LCCNGPELLVCELGFLLFCGPFQVPACAVGDSNSFDGREHSGASSGFASPMAQISFTFVLLYDGNVAVAHPCTFLCMRMMRLT